MEKTYNPNLELLKLVIMGSVDDGKSTFIGRLLYDLEEIYEDQLAAVKRASAKMGNNFIDLSLLTDGLSAEREQKITIDAAYRYLTTASKRFIIADVPGHEQYTKNMATGASQANLAVVIIDAQRGVLKQSKRHLFISSLLGANHVLVAVNKMDAVGYSQEVFQKIKSDFSDFLTKLTIKDIQFVPVSALQGDMIVKRSNNMDWYQGPTALSYLENASVASDINLINFRFPVQFVIRPSADFRGYAGQIESGTIKKGERVKILPSGQITRVKSIITDRSEKDYAFAPQAIVLALEDNLDISRGDMIVRENNFPELGNKLEAMVCWMSEEPLTEGKRHILKQTTRNTACFVDKVFYKIDVDNLHRIKNNSLQFNEIGRVAFNLTHPLVFDPYEQNRGTGSFILIDDITNNTVGAGMILRKRKEMAKESAADKLFRYLQEKNIPCQKADIEEALNKIFYENN